MNPIFLIFLVFVMIQCFFFIFSLIAEAIYDFFLRWWILFFHSLINRLYLPVKKIVSLFIYFFFTKANNKKNHVMSIEFGKLILYIIDTHFTSIARRYQLVNSVNFFKVVFAILQTTITLEQITKNLNFCFCPRILENY